MEILDSGLVIPLKPEPPKPPPEPPPFRGIEVHDDRRKELVEMIGDLYRKFSTRGIVYPDREDRFRRAAVRRLADELLGPDVEFWEYT